MDITNPKQAALNLTMPHDKYCIEHLYWQLVYFTTKDNYKIDVAWQAQEALEKLIENNPDNVNLLITILEVYE